MEELTPITRREVFLAKASGQNVETPTPVTREEVFLDEIAKGGGGSSGGGVLVATMDMQTMTLDKTWKEMFDSAFCVIKFASDSQVSTLVPHTIKVQSGNYDVMATSNGGQSELFRTDSENGYPVYYHDS